MNTLTDDIYQFVFSIYILMQSYTYEGRRSLHRRSNIHEVIDQYLIVVIPIEEDATHFIKKKKQFCEKTCILGLH